MSSEYLSSYMDNSGSRAEDTVPASIKKPGHELAIETGFHYRRDYALNADALILASSVAGQANSLLARAC